MDALKNLSTKFKNLFDGKDKNKISKFVLILGLIGIALIFLSEVLPEGGKRSGDPGLGHVARHGAVP